MPNEATITVNGHQITPAQSMTLRVALETFAIDLDGGSLGNDESGKAMTKLYTDQIKEIRKVLYK